MDRWVMGSIVMAGLGCNQALLAQAGQPGMYGGVSTGRIVGSVTDPGFAGRLGATVSGLPQTSGQVVAPHGPVFSPSGLPGYYSPPAAGRGYRQPSRYNRTIAVPYGVPVYYGGGYGYQEAPPPPETIVQPVQPGPSVIINQYYSPEVVRPQLREYTDLPEPPGKDEGPVKVYPPPKRDPLPEPPAPKPQARVARPRVVDPAEQGEGTKAEITLLAFKDSNVVAAIGYWVQGETLHYVTSTFAKKTAPANTLDKTLSEQLNRERNVEFRLESVTP